MVAAVVKADATRRVLVILGHPDAGSLNGALADAYSAGAMSSGATVRRLNLGDLQFDPVLRHGYRGAQPLEPDLLAAQESLRWAEHITLVYPVWWAAAPSLLKGFVDRVFQPGFAFRYRAGSAFPEKLLSGRTARLLVTMDAPPWYHRWILGAPDIRSLKTGTLQFSGIAPVRSTLFGPVRTASEQQRTQWVQRAAQLGMAAQ